MPVSVRRNPYHPTRDIVVLQEPWTAAEVAEVARRHPRPVSQKAVPGTEKHAKLLAAGARPYQQCPPLEVDAAAPPVRSWCAEHALLPVRPLDDLTARDLTELWTSWYEIVHRGWSPAAPHAELRDLFAELAGEIDAARSVRCELDGEVVAAAFVFSGDVPPEILTEALLPDHPRARDAVASCLAVTLGAAEGVVRCDGHVGDPHFHPLWTTVPGVYAGANDPLDLLEITPDAASR